MNTNYKKVSYYTTPAFLLLQTGYSNPTWDGDNLQGNSSETVVQVMGMETSPQEAPQK